ncbi:hypothetical protein C9374_011732 [Naegleria lovaniensis]|uniref:Inhibitor of growth protein n=1 Tax=Naegleria lovaniensis TaxID=51637 RepID=A0AA88G9L9_NAELO|nr:uncharacterized protein C9374_011732 [Naegleria lovaniensis]KAG2373847.1 hypothetical protein C9374_011732 [Naegleria lovaniensis]
MLSLETTVTPSLAASSEDETTTSNNKVSASSTVSTAHVGGGSSSSSENSSSKSKSKKKQGKSSKSSGSGSTTTLSSSPSPSSSGNVVAEPSVLESFVKSIETLPIEIKKDLATIRELDKKCAKNINLANESSVSKKTDEEKLDEIKPLMTDAINLCNEKCSIAKRAMKTISLHIEQIDKDIEELTKILQQKPQVSLKLESLYIPQLSEDQEVSYFTNSEHITSLSGDKSTLQKNKRLVQHSENLKSLKIGALKAFPEKELHSHVFNHTPEQEGLVRGNSTTTRSSYSHSSTTSTKKAEKDTTSLVTIKTAGGSVISVPAPDGTSDNAFRPNPLPLLSVETRKTKQKKSTSRAHQDITINCTDITAVRKEVVPTAERTVDISEIKIPKKDGSKKRKQISGASSSSKKKKEQAVVVEPVVDQTIQYIPIEEEGPPDNTKYCYCQKTMAEKDDKMVGCDGVKCPYNAWFHISCLSPSEDYTQEKFYCKACSKKYRKKKKH